MVYNSTHMDNVYEQNEYQGIYLNLFYNLMSDWSKRLGLKGKINLTFFLRIFDNLLSNYLIFKTISCMQWLFWVILLKLRRGLVLAFSA